VFILAPSRGRAFAFLRRTQERRVTESDASPPASRRFCICSAQVRLDNAMKLNNAISLITQSHQIGCSNPRGEVMNYVKSFLIAFLLVVDLGLSHAAVRIAYDRGGRIDIYVHKYQRLASSGESVVIDGLCASACTIVLSAIPHDKICVTSRAALGFHSAWGFGDDGRTFTDPEATLMLYSMYPTPVQHWITRRGGLTPRPIFLRGKPLQAMYQACGIDVP